MLNFSESEIESRSVLSDSLQFHGIGHGILQARILEWVAVPFYRGSSQPRDQTQVSRIAGRFFTSWATREEYTRQINNAKLPSGSTESIKIGEYKWGYFGHLSKSKVPLSCQLDVWSFFKNNFILYGSMMD